MAASQVAQADDVDDIEIRQDEAKRLEDEGGLDEKYPNRPTNHSKTLPFHDLFLSLFNPLNENKKKSTGPAISRKKQGPHGPIKLAPHEIRQNIIEQFLSKWRKEVGNDIYPVLRLILPEKDRGRAMYGLKEKTIAKLLIRIMKIDKNSEDGYNLLNWKQPGQNTASKVAGDFAGRCFEAINKRAMRTDVGTMSISEVNDLLDKLSAAQKEEAQRSIFEEFYKRMNAEEMMWLVRIILRQMKVGATEKTFFNIWHPDADALFNISSDLRRVCWELYDPSLRLEEDDRGITLMQCFQPQLAQFQMHSVQKMVDKMRPTEEDPVFWIEEKLDGERMQLHMISDGAVAGGKRFAFWSRKAKDYTYLYGNGFFDENGALTRHIKEAFHEGVENIILDGEMITWDPEEDAMVPFGTLKTAALDLSKNMHSKGHRPLYRVFDLLYLNGKALTNYTLRDRRSALEKSVRTIHRRLEVHTYVEAKSYLEVDPLLRKVVQDASEGLVLKNPRSPYRLNERNDDWMKVKPEYMTEYGESLDCLVVGGYYGSGHRGGSLSSFLCGLRVDENDIQKGAKPMKCVSFFKVGGGFTAADYAEIRHRTDGKWVEWNSKHPPSEFVELAGGSLQYERPDVWIRPDESVVLAVKAASVSVTDQFKLGVTLRFPRFKMLRTDRDWTSALTVNGFFALEKNVEKERSEKQFQIDDHRKKRQRLSRKRPLAVIGSNVSLKMPYDGAETNVFKGLKFYVMTDSATPLKKPKAELEQMIKSNGGKIFQKHDAVPDIISVGERRAVKVVSVMKHGENNVVRPSWIFDCIKQSQVDVGREKLLLPFEPNHMFFVTDKSRVEVTQNVDKYGDSFSRDVDVQELRKIFESMPIKFEPKPATVNFRAELQEHEHDLGQLAGWIFEGLRILVIQSDDYQSSNHSVSGSQPIYKPHGDRMKVICNIARFAGADVTADLNDEEVTHVVIGKDVKNMRAIRQMISSRKRLPRIVTTEWIERSWAEHTLLDEERFAPQP